MMTDGAAEAGWPAMEGLVYLDCHATTPIDPRVAAAMWPFLTEHFGNAGSDHAFGWAAAAAVDRARAAIATAINASPEEIVFTSGATEANNLAIKGVAEAYLSKGRHLITVATEHAAVLDPCRYLQTLGFEVTVLPVDGWGLLDLAALARSIRPETVLVSVMLANNEIGLLQPIAQIGQLCRDRGVLFHTDAAQAIGKVPIDVAAMNIDLMSLTAHKVYGPKGIGALYVRRADPRVNLAPQLHGGGQERGRRAGTLFVPQIVGFGRAIELAVAEMAAESVRMAALRDRLWSYFDPARSGLAVALNGHPTQRLPGNLHLTIEGLNPADVLNAVRPIAAVSSGSACQSESGKPSHVLQAIGRSPGPKSTALRFGLGRFHTEAVIDRVGQGILEALRRLVSETASIPRN